MPRTAPHWSSSACLKRAFGSVLRLARMDTPTPAVQAADLLFMRRLISTLVQDLPLEARCALDVRILQADSHEALWHLRSLLFGAISLQFGEHEARQRLQQLDAHWH